MERCACCEERPAGWAIAAQPLRRYRGWRPVGPAERTGVCSWCARWLAQLAADARSGEGRLFGQPGANGRHLVFDDQCAACCESPAERAERTAWLRGEQAAGELFLCVPCARWLLGLAASGRTLQGSRERHLDGGYGAWPHPRLRGMRTWSSVRDRGAAEVIGAAAAAMGLVEAGSAEEADAVLIEAGAAADLCRELGPVAGRVIVLAGPGAQVETARALEAGAFGWVTAPSTPQQLTAMLARLARGERRGGWDPATCLPLLEPGRGGRPWLWVEALGPEEAWATAWLVRRFSRGYDAIGAVDGGIGVVPLVPPGAVGRVAARLRQAAAGARVEVRGAEDPPRRRFEAAG